jgi:tetratricopeptide (TPR) repeat protein
MQSHQDIIINSALISASPFIVIGVAAALYFRRIAFKMVVFGALFFLITLLPVLQIIPVGSAMVADRYTYIPSVGICLIFAGAISRIVNNRSGGNANRRTIVYAGLITMFIIFGVLTYQRCKIWNDSLTLWNDTIAKYPSAIAYNNRGTLQNGPNGADRALVDFNRAIDLDPAFAKAYNNRGIAYLSEGNLDSALKDFKKTIELQPDYFDAYNNRGIIFAYLKEYDKALADFNRAQSLNPGYLPVYLNRGIAYMQKGSCDLAIRDFDKVIMLDPTNSTAIEKRNQAMAYLLKIK